MYFAAAVAYDSICVVTVNVRKINMTKELDDATCAILPGMFPNLSFVKKCIFAIPRLHLPWFSVPMKNGEDMPTMAAMQLKKDRKCGGGNDAVAVIAVAADKFFVGIFSFFFAVVNM
jgi:hypothetical protein